ncbi:pigment-dispersing hormone type 1-like [Penaeus japonicus]|uniref:pigment-dispersing hormone type 1-like n=1 Tax=Penaeus japonicus TaxID=27405 RepID=UPI001C713C36|nr:pigment-dispersing hormone type 1-like [Penaeus japonicus]
MDGRPNLEEVETSIRGGLQAPAVITASKPRLITRKMRSIAVVVLLVVMALSLQGTVADSSLKYFEREVVSELAAQILRVAQGPSAFVAGPHKRNSELINSSLGDP